MMIHYGKPHFVHLIVGISEPKNSIPGDGFTRAE